MVKRLSVWLWTLICALLILYGMQLAADAQDEFTIERVNVTSSGVQANGTGLTPPLSLPSISADGRYVAFESIVSNLVYGDTNQVYDVFVHDRQTGQTTRASVASDGTQSNGSSSFPALSADGRYVIFFSGASNLVPDDTNNVADIFVHDQQTGQTTRVSVASDGTQANARSSLTAISADGRFAAFQSQASNLVSGDTNVCTNSPVGQCGDIFVHDLETGETTRVSVSSEGVQANNVSIQPVISTDGRFVVFGSYASNLVPDDTNVCGLISSIPGECPDIFVHDRQTGETTRVSVAADGTQADDGSSYPFISATGRWVTFVSSASNLVPEGTPTCDIDPEDPICTNIFRVDLQTGERLLVSVGLEGSAALGYSSAPTISSDGRYIAFHSSATNLIPGPNRDCEAGTISCVDVFFRDIQTGQTGRVSVASNGTLGDQGSYYSMISDDGQYIVFQSDATNLVSGDTNGLRDMFVARAVIPPDPPVEPTPEVTVEPTEESTPEITPEVTVEPTEESTPEITPEVTVEPTEESTPEITPEVTIEPTPEVTPPASPPDAVPRRNVFDTNTPTLTWNRVTRATQYQLQIDDSRNFNAPGIYAFTTTGVETTHTVQTPLPDGTYYWRVRALSANRTGDWSSAEEMVIDAD